MKVIKFFSLAILLLLGSMCCISVVDVTKNVTTGYNDILDNGVDVYRSVGKITVKSTQGGVLIGSGFPINSDQVVSARARMHCRL